ncbi:hypothetical protein KVR01_013360 [Diaporthe batatas]|uniref:uncharacterized protein n=1 Tax=Diaporthe batatas TaxID=748121 RepID=UPI001D041C03|nr:uncharacterized protein KVR01_013360 [Diaporthe batatas]KAG8156755.1 hypothetical protein KVR01_013360 [Diaporthe batatas]
MPPKQLPPFNHEKLLDINIQSETPENIRALQDQIQVAEHNVIAVLQAAQKIADTFSSLDRVTNFNLQIIDNLVQDIRTIYRLLRSRLFSQFPGVPPRGQLAAPGDRIPEKIRENAYSCLCPLTVLLQSVAQCFSDLKVSAPSEAGNDAWGTIQPLHRLLRHMEGRLLTTNNVVRNETGDYIGLAFCIMLHERNSRYLVTSTSPSYGSLKGLDDYGKHLRILHMRRIRQSLSEEFSGRVQLLQAYSEDVKRERRAAGKAWSGAISTTLDEPEVIKGHNAAFRTTGRFMTACLLDHLRFQIGKTAYAADIENATTRKERSVAGPTSCAEWELYVTLLQSPDPEEPYAPQYVAVTYGMPKSKTWETDKTSSRPAPTAQRSPAPTPLPPMSRPIPLRPGQAKSATFANHSQAPPHPAAGQVIVQMPTPPRQPEPQQADPPKKAKSRWGLK